MVKVRVYSPDVSVGSAGFMLITLKYWNSLFQSHLPGENAVISAAEAFTQHQYSFHLVPIIK